MDSGSEENLHHPKIVKRRERENEQEWCGQDGRSDLSRRLRFEPNGKIKQVLILYKAVATLRVRVEGPTWFIAWPESVAGEGSTMTDLSRLMSNDHEITEKVFRIHLVRAILIAVLIGSYTLQLAYQDGRKLLNRVMRFKMNVKDGRRRSELSGRSP
jgi:hypothetical protein